MIIDCARPILDLEGRQVQSPNQEGKPLTVRDVMMIALVSAIKGDEELDVAKNADLFQLAVRVSTAGETVEIDKSEAKTIIERVNKTWGRVVLGRIKEILEK